MVVVNRKLVLASARAPVEVSNENIHCPGCASHNGCRKKKSLSLAAAVVPGCFIAARLPLTGSAARRHFGDGADCNHGGEAFPVPLQRHRHK